MIITIEELFFLLTKYRYLKEDTFLVLISKIKTLNKYLNYNDEFFNDTEFNMDCLLNVNDVYRKLQIHYKGGLVNQLNQIIQILEVNSIKYRDLINEYKIVYNQLNRYKNKKSYYIKNG